MREFIWNLFLLLSASSCQGNVQDLQKRVEEEVKKQLGGLEAMVVNIMEQELVGRYGMIRRCSKPEVEHGIVECSSDDIVPGERCSVKCSAGYTATSETTDGNGTPKIWCQDGGKTWSGELRCDLDKSLLVVSGGSDSPSVEVINFHNSTGCELNIPDIPKTKHGEVRLMHNMFYFPKIDKYKPFQLLVCNGLSQDSKSTCDSWTLGDSTWKSHSNPNHGDGANYKMRHSGRYGAGSYSWDRKHYVVGGMLNKGNDHRPTNSIRYHGDSWQNRKYSSWEKAGYQMKSKRTLFCVAQLNNSRFFAIGGHSGKLEKSAEILRGSGVLPDMETARNGHACSGIFGDDAAKILVSGGSDSPHRSGSKALKTSEMYSSDTHSWEKVGDMIHTRFGHAMVNIGGRIIALGGKEWNPDVPLKNAEEFDAATKTWTNIGDVMSVPRANFGYALIPHFAIPGCTIH